MAFISEVIFSGFVSKVVNDIADVTKDKIKAAVNCKTAKHQNLESQIYNITVDVLNNITVNRYKNHQDHVYDMAEVLLNGLKDTKGVVLGNIEFALQTVGLNIDKNKCIEFQMLLYEKLGYDEYSELFRAILLLLLQHKNQYDHAVYAELLQKSIQVEQKVDLLNQKFDQIKLGNESDTIPDVLVKFRGDKKRDYIRNWNSRMFLHADNDENPLTLSDAFIVPDFWLFRNTAGMGINRKDPFDKIIETFVEYDRTSSMLIIGEPGIGKSTTISWIADKYRDDERVVILRFRDWEREDLERGLLKAICNTLECRKNALECAILVLDGFDEMKSLDIRHNVLNDFLTDIKDFENFKCIITSRPAYIDTQCSMDAMIALQAFGIDKVDIFYKKITGKELNSKDKIQSNLEVLGIPVILYMAIMSGVDLGKNQSKAELYNRIFAKKGGIFDRFFDGKNQYSAGSQMMRNPDNIQYYLKFLGETAFKMFEKRRLILSAEEFQIPELVYQGNVVSVLEFPIKHLFESTSKDIEFIHGSIYEYFVSEYIINSITAALNENGIKKINLAGVLGSLLKKNHLSDEILEFLKYKIANSELAEEYDVVNETFELMMKDGMTYYTNRCYQNPFDCEMNVFANMLELLHSWVKKYYVFDKSIFFYMNGNPDIRYNFRKAIINDDIWGLFFRAADLRYADLREAYLRDVDPCTNGSDFRHAILRKADLIGITIADSDFRYTDLRGAYLMGTIIREVDLRYANLRGAHLTYAELNNVDFRGADLRGAYLTYAKLENVDLRDAYLTDAVVDENQLKYFKKCKVKGSRVYIKGKGFRLL